MTKNQYDLLSNRENKVLKKEQERITKFSAEKLSKLLEELSSLEEDKQLAKSKLLIEQLLKENAEFKILYDDIYEQFNRKLKKGKPCILEMGHAYGELIPVKENLDSTLEWKRGRTKRMIEKMNKPIVLRIRTWFSIKQFPVYFVEEDGESTYIPLDETPIEIKKRAENMLKLGNTMKKMAFIDSVMAGLKNIRKWFDYIPYLVNLGIVLAFALLISQYQLLPK